ncbi:hypothetical protein [Lentzea jiangxiensis]|uniref:Uncharacterized protein n=1 Tax=Lentzea jiangxiensis TaxID=641025 RepID=A0A1H0X423_9PSEU|nr:hypothetical protein [Lentzea jiangxiensis]SDP97708.1 hypothetical protein SAMN05421507_13336 [Lentzea jiangxiensis]
MKLWALLGLGALVALALAVRGSLGSEPGPDSYQTLRGVEMSRRFTEIEVVQLYDPLWLVVAAVLAVAAAVAVLYEHRHRFRRGDQANG